MAAVCLLLLLAVSLAQSSHVHADTTHHLLAYAHEWSSVAPADDGEEHCQLCQAMHSALPVLGSTVPALFLAVQSATPDPAPLFAHSRWLLAMFSRPPPAPITV